MKLKKSSASTRNSCRQLAFIKPSVPERIRAIFNKAKKSSASTRNSCRQLAFIKPSAPERKRVIHHNVISFIMIILFAFSFSGCNIVNLTTNNLLRPPKTMGDEAEIEQLIADTADDSYTLKYPKSGAYRSAIIRFDLNGDKSDEAIAFFRNSTDVAKVHMLLMYSQGESWKISADYVTETTDIDCIEFADIDGNGSSEVLIGYTTYTPNTNRLACYSYNLGKTSEIKSGQSYSSFYCNDFNSDGKDEIISLLLFSTENEATASMLSYDKAKKILFSKSTVAMDPNVVRYKNVAITELDSTTKGIVIDGLFASEELNTQLIYYDKELSLLKNPLYNEKIKSQTQRSVSVLSTDINNDNSIEIPVVSKLSHSSNEPIETVANSVKWLGFSPKDEKTSTVCNSVINMEFSYIFKMPEIWNNKSITALYKTENNSTEFYLYNKEQLDDKLFELKVFEIADWDIGKGTDEYTLISKDEKYAYTFKKEAIKNELMLSDDEIKTAFMLITNSTV